MRRALTRSLVAAVAAAAIVVVALGSPGEAKSGKRPSLAQLAGQRIVFGFDGTSAPQEILDRIHNREAAGVILYGRNISSRDQLRTLDQAFQNARPPHDLPVLIMTDQEGGLVKRVDGPPYRSPAQIGQIDSKKVARSTGRATGRNLRDVGVNVNLAPVVDVARRGSEMERLGRAYSEDKDVVTAMAGAFARGMAERHVAATAKHFPGLGAAQLDEDRNMNVISYTRSQLRHIDEVPYKSLARKRVPLVMVSTAEYPAFASGPALFSHRIATRELRRYIKFHGVSITDDLETPVASNYGSPAQRAVMSARAGVDLLLFAQTTSAGDQAASGLVDAVHNHQLTRHDLERSVARIKALRRSLK